MQIRDSKIVSETAQSVLRILGPHHAIDEETYSKIYAAIHKGIYLKQVSDDIKKSLLAKPPAGLTKEILDNVVFTLLDAYCVPGQLVSQDYVNFRVKAVYDMADLMILYTLFLDKIVIHGSLSLLEAHRANLPESKSDEVATQQLFEPWYFTFEKDVRQALTELSSPENGSIAADSTKCLEYFNVNAKGISEVAALAAEHLLSGKEGAPSFAAVHPSYPEGIYVLITAVDKLQITGQGRSLALIQLSFKDSHETTTFITVPIDTRQYQQTKGV